MIAAVFEAAADLGPLARHGFEQHRGGLLGSEHLVEHLGDHGDARLGALLDVASRMEVVVAMRREFHAAQVVGHGFARELPGVRLVRTAIQRIRGMRDQRAERFGLHPRLQLGGVFGIDRLRRTPARVAREKRKRVRPDRRGGLAHGEKTLRRRKVASDSKHGASVLPRCNGTSDVTLIAWHYNEANERRRMKAPSFTRRRKTGARAASALVRRRLDATLRRTARAPPICGEAVREHHPT